MLARRNPWQWAFPSSATSGRMLPPSIDTLLPPLYTRATGEGAQSQPDTPPSQTDRGTNTDTPQSHIHLGVKLKRHTPPPPAHIHKGCHIQLGAQARNAPSPSATHTPRQKQHPRVTHTRASLILDTPLVSHILGVATHTHSQITGKPKQLTFSQWEIYHRPLPPLVFHTRVQQHPQTRSGG